MKMLVRGIEPQERVDLIMQLTKIGSENIKSALIDHLSKGLSENDAAMLNDVPQQNFNRALKRLNEVAAVVEKIKEFDWDKLAAAKVEDSYSDLIPKDDFEWGMINGKLSALRWVLGDEWDMLDT